MILSNHFFKRPAPEVAPDLLGKFLVRERYGKNVSVIITETEAYHGLKDKASHAARGLTMRNKIMFGPAGRWYVYFIYGSHWMLNISTGKVGEPSAVLLRGVIGYNGPGKLTKYLHIDNKLNSLTASKKSSLWIEDLKIIKLTPIKKGPRIGVDYAGPIWSKKPYRFWLDI